VKWSSVSNSKLENSSKRIDAEFYGPSYLELESDLKNKNAVPLETVCTLHDGPFGSEVLSDSYSKSGIPVLQMNSISKEGLIKIDTCPFLDSSERENIKKFLIYPGEIAVTKVGFLGYSTVIPDDYDAYFFRRELTRLKVRNADEFIPEYIATFFNSKYGRLQSLRFSSGTTRDRILLTSQKQILIPNLDIEFQRNISRVLKKAYSFSYDSKNHYSQAQTLLLKELDLLNWQPKHQLSYTKTFSDTQTAERFDAEYFQPKYEEVIEKIKAYSGGFDELGALVNIKDKNFNPKESDAYKYIELSNINTTGDLTIPESKQGQELPTRARRKVSENDVLISSIEGSLESIAMVTNSDSNLVCSTGFYVIQSHNFKPSVLLVLLKSLVGQLQLKKGCSGTILTAISKEEFKKVILPKVSISAQEEIESHIQKMYEAKEQSKSLLEIAKTGVEKAIETAEEDAIRWMIKEVEVLGIDYAPIL
jgi:restriction endonuclease S subunit